MHDNLIADPGPYSFRQARYPRTWGYVRRQDDKFPAAVPARLVFLSAAGRDRQGHMAQHLVSEGMAVCFVNRFEHVNIGQNGPAAGFRYRLEMEISWGSLLIEIGTDSRARSGGRSLPFA